MSENTEKLHIISALVSNESGVLTRISGLFARRCYNIHSLAACATEDSKLSRMTIVVRGDNTVLKQIVSQLAKVPDCIITSELDANNAVLCELLLIKLKTTPQNIPDIAALCGDVQAKIVDSTHGSTVIEAAGTPPALDGFIGRLNAYEIIELSRTGLTALERGAGKLNPDPRD